MSNYYILQGGKPVPVDDILTWAKWFEAHDQDRIVRQDRFASDVLISTVFLALNYTPFVGCVPILYELMIFGGPYNDYQERFSTKEEALARHMEIFEAMQKGTMAEVIGDD
jgi:hypothetical protein